MLRVAGSSIPFPRRLAGVDLKRALPAIIDPIQPPRHREMVRATTPPLHLRISLLLHTSRSLQRRDFASVGPIPSSRPHRQVVYMCFHTLLSRLLSLTSVQDCAFTHIGTYLTPPLQGTYLRHPSTCISLHAPTLLGLCKPTSVISQIAQPLLPSCPGPGMPRRPI